MVRAVINRGQPLQRPPAAAQRPRPPGVLQGKTAAVLGGDSGIGRAVAIAFAKAGADLAIIYLNDHRSAEETRQVILQQNVRCVLVAGDASAEGFCRNAVKRIVRALGRLDILANNASEQRRRDGESEPLETDLLGMFYLTKAAIPHLAAGGIVINTTAVTAWHDHAHLIDDTATTGTIVSFTRSVARALTNRGIRVNAVTPGSLRTGGPPREQAPALEALAPSYLLLAAGDGSIRTGQVLHVKAQKTAA
jgi:NAD(P)-dependent dehydrogenase (short-subunit alcohol dehydrogenase family)